MKIETDLMETVCRATDAIKCWLKHREHFIPVIEDKLLENVYFTWASDKLYIQASGNKEQLTTLFRVLAVNGFHMPGDYKRPEEHQPEWSGLFRKNYTDAGGADWFFDIYASFTSTVCQKIQVGIEVKEVPVYKIVCGDTVHDLSEIEDDIPF